MIVPQLHNQLLPMISNMSVAKVNAVVHEKEKASWTERQKGILIDILLQIQLQRNFTDGGYKKEEWTKIIKQFGILLFKHLENSPTSRRILDNSKFFPWFDNCDGALDGTHIPAIVPDELQQTFKNRKKFISQNVLGVCNFEAIFIYALCGWEG